jgi:uncharacterized protein YndB with AHSA1/START domain
MDFKATEDIDAPRAAVFAALTDFDLIEERLAKKGVNLDRTAAQEGALQGIAWRAEFCLNGKVRSTDVTLRTVEPGERLIFDGAIDGLDTQARIALSDAPGGTTRLAVSAVLKPCTLSARLVVQSLKLARGKVDASFARWVAEYAAELEARLNRVG